MTQRRFPPNTRIKNGCIEFRKVYQDKTICKTWPLAKEKYAFEEIYRLLGKINRNQDIFELEERRITMTEAADIFWDLHASKSPENDSFKSYLARIKHYFGTTWYDKVTHEEIEAFLKWVRETPVHYSRYKRTPPRLLAPGTVNHHHTTLISIFNSIPRWMELDKIRRVRLTKQRNPASLIPKMSEEQYTRTRVLSESELQRLVAAATPRAADIIKVAVFTLLRFKDLKKADLGRKDGVTALRGIQAKTQKPYEIAIGELSISSLDFTNFHREFEKAVKKTGIKDFQFRDLRRTGATYLFRRTNDLGMVQRRLGHASPAMTKKYLGILDTDNIKASEILGSIITGLKAGDTKPSSQSNPL